jgi:hypothetical protein
MRRPVRLSALPPSSLDEAFVREMWQFRLRFMALRPGVDPELDFALFSKTVRAADTAVVARDDLGVLRGMAIVRGTVRTFEGRRFLWIWPDYGFIDPMYRGNPMSHLKLAAAVHGLQRRHAGLPAYFVSVAWPSGFLSQRIVADTRILGDPAASDWERRMLIHVAEAMCDADFEPDRLRVRMRVLPRSPLRVPRGPLARRALSYYMAHNADWSEGYAAVVYYRLSHPAIQWLRMLGGLLFERAAKRLSRP